MSYVKLGASVYGYDSDGNRFTGTYIGKHKEGSGYTVRVIKHVQTDTGEVIETRLPIYNQ